VQLSFTKIRSFQFLQVGVKPFRLICAFVEERDVFV